MLYRMLIVCVCSVALGCGSSTASKVSGVVTVDGIPLTSGDVTFSPVDEGQIAYGKIDGSGNYTLSTENQVGAKPGNYVVTVVATGEPPASDKPPPLLTPAKYSDKATSDLKFAVKPGFNQIHLPLLSK